MPEIRTRLRPLLLLLMACAVAVTSLGGPAAAARRDPARSTPGSIT